MADGEDKQNGEKTSGQDKGQVSHAVPKKHLKVRHFLDAINLGYIGAGTATLINAWQKIDGDFYKRRYGEDQFTEVMEKRANEIEKVELRIEQKHGRNFTWRGLVTQVKGTTEIDNVAKKEIDKAVFGEDAKTGVMGTIQKFGKLEPYERKNVALSMITVFTIGAGAIYSFTKESRMARRLEREEVDNDKLRNNQSMSR